jgi:hypothetical protein
MVNPGRRARLPDKEPCMRIRRQIAILALALTLAAPWIAAAEARPEVRNRVEHPVVSTSEFLSHAWDFITGLWGAAPACDAGSSMDPLGCPVRPTTDEGSSADPLG